MLEVVQFGIELLSRGAKKSVFVEKDKKALDCIHKNITKARLENDSSVLGMDVFSALNTLKISEAFDFIFMDPPYNKDIERQVLATLSDKSYVTSETTIIIEASLDTDFDYIDDMGYCLIKEKIYKTNKHIFLKKA